MKAIFEFLKTIGPWGPLVISIIDGAGVPNPGGPDILLIWLSANRPEIAYLSAALSVVGSLLGNAVLFMLARKGGERYLEKRMHQPRGAKIRTWYQRYGLMTIFIPSLLPIPMPFKLFVVCAGALGVNPLAFVATLAAGRIPRYFGLAYLGHELGEKSSAWLRSHTWQFGEVALALIVFCFLLILIEGRYRNAKARADAS